MMYNKIVEEYFFLPRHVGVIATDTPLSVHFRSGQPEQSVLIGLYMSCASDGLIKKMTFKAKGNPYVIAAMEWLCRQVEGVTIDKLPSIDYQLLIKELKIPMNQYPVALQIEDVYKETVVLMKKKLKGMES